MLLTTHILIGGALGQMAGNAPAGFTLGVASHFALDKIPHFDLGIWHKSGKDYNWGAREWVVVGLDIVATIFVLIFLLPKSIEINFLFGALGGVSVDLLDNVPFWKKKFRATGFGKWFSKFHSCSHFKKSEWLMRYKWLALLGQIAIIGLIFGLIKSKI
ncbi:MAG: hypothetical protein CEN89_731 [Candidatus Berkelbacteria bacterium Licking1014_7]|uniref:Uncharacterized protein n=1 Tax=Candidatus Berkelbacteria bacterium Licking1014_7 TaxID=2017147 RepID=A0A554LHR1_9BACT|nr:MAG: hypothetical protein CEN89_731 [Candidatus Berkelbacteria bacterium Licking1014_7]